MRTSMCDWITLLCSIKLTEHCKSAIMEKIKIIVKKDATNPLLFISTIFFPQQLLYYFLTL